MKETPIRFPSPMVRALLEGTKTQTRRVVKPQPDVSTGWEGSVRLRFKTRKGADLLDEALNPPGPPIYVSLCPYGVPGDRLWVRETFKAVASGEVKNGYGEVRYGWAYMADAATAWNERTTIIHDMTDQPATGPMQFRELPWKPSSHMPRRASRITLEIINVRVERLQDISEADAIAEGIERTVLSDGWRHYSDPKSELAGLHPFSTAVGSYASLWESLYGAGSWDANPWVWVIEFRRLVEVPAP